MNKNKKLLLLLPCPFCGRAPELRRDRDGFSYVVCANDGCYIKTDGHLNYESAVNQWNTRKSTEIIEGIIEWLEKELRLANEDKERCLKECPLLYDKAKGYSLGIDNTLSNIKKLCNKAGGYNI